MPIATPGSGSSAAPNGGVAAARNRGWAAIEGRSEFLVFLDSDDVWETDTLQVLIDALDARPDLVSAYGLARCTDLDGQLVADDDLEENMRRRVAFVGERLVSVDPEQPTTFAGLVHQNWTFTPGIHLMRRPSPTRSVRSIHGPIPPTTGTSRSV